MNQQADVIYEGHDQGPEELSAEVAEAMKEFRQLPPAQDVDPDGKILGGPVGDEYRPIDPGQVAGPQQGPPPPGHHQPPPGPAPQHHEQPQAPQQPAQPPDQPLVTPEQAYDELRQQLAEAQSQASMYKNMLGSTAPPGAPGMMPGQPAGMAIPPTTPGAPLMPGQTAQPHMAQPQQGAQAPPPQPMEVDFLKGRDHRDMEPAELQQAWNEGLAQRDRALIESISHRVSDTATSVFQGMVKNSAIHQQFVDAPGNEHLKNDPQGMDWCMQTVQNQMPWISHDVQAVCTHAKELYGRQKAMAGAPPPAAVAQPQAPPRGPVVPRVAPANQQRPARGAPGLTGQRRYMRDVMEGYAPGE